VLKGQGRRAGQGRVGQGRARQEERRGDGRVKVRRKLRMKERKHRRMGGQIVKNNVSPSFLVHLPSHWVKEASGLCGLGRDGR
jgi:hypothetical protein